MEITGRNPSCRNITLFQEENTSIYSHDDFPACLFTRENWLVVEPTHVKNMSQNGFIFPNIRAENKICFFNHQLENIALLKWYKNFTQKYPSTLADVFVISQAESMQKCFTKAPCRIRLANLGSNENCGPRFLVKQSDLSRPKLEGGCNTSPDPKRNKAWNSGCFERGTLFYGIS